MAAYNPRDYYFQKAKKENYAARSVFKLEEMDQRYRIIRPEMKILDLGAAPGSWAQYCSKKVGKLGQILGVDLQKIHLTLPNAVFVQADLRDLQLGNTFRETGIHPPFDLVLSDMAPKTTGIRLADQTRSLELCELALSIADRFLKKGGTFVAKIFHGEDFEHFRALIREQYETHDILRPKSTRKESKEVFFIAQKKKNPPTEGGLDPLPSAGS